MGSDSSGLWPGEQWPHWTPYKWGAPGAALILIPETLRGSYCCLTTHHSCQSPVWGAQPCICPIGQQRKSHGVDHYISHVCTQYIHTYKYMLQTEWCPQLLKTCPVSLHLKHLRLEKGWDHGLKRLTLIVGSERLQWKSDMLHTHPPCPPQLYFSPDYVKDCLFPVLALNFIHTSYTAEHLWIFGKGILDCIVSYCLMYWAYVYLYWL